MLRVIDPQGVQVSDLLKDQANKLVISRSDGSGILYYTAHLRVNLPVPQVEPLSRGIIVERRYTIGTDTKSITEAKAKTDALTKDMTAAMPPWFD